MKWLVTSTFRKNVSGVANYLLPTKSRHDAVRIVVLTLPMFGEHLLSSDQQRPVAFVESEKSALISSFYLPQYL